MAKTVSMALIGAGNSKKIIVKIVKIVIATGFEILTVWLMNRYLNSMYKINTTVSVSNRISMR